MGPSFPASFRIKVRNMSKRKARPQPETGPHQMNSIKKITRGAGLVKRSD